MGRRSSESIDPYSKYLFDYLGNQISRLCYKNILSIISEALLHQSAVSRSPRLHLFPQNTAITVYLQTVEGNSTFNMYLEQITAF